MRCDFNYVYKLIAELAAHPRLGRPDLAFSADCQRILEIINVMTPDERCNSDLVLDRTRRERIAREAGVSLADVDALVAQRQVLATQLRRMWQE